MQRRKDFAREQILLIRQHLGAGVFIIAQERIYESTLTGRRFQKTFYLDSGIFQRVRDGINDAVIGIERCQHRSLQRIHIVLELPVIVAIIMYQPTQFYRRREQFNVALAPLGSIHQFISIVENTLQPTKSGILPQNITLLGTLRRASRDTKTKGKPYRFDVVAHSL